MSHSFEDHKCRICKKVLCCVKCRSKHENNEHKIYPECDICVYGRTYLRNPSEDLLLHIKETHWPLHCIKCKKLYENINDLKIHTKCSFENEAAQNAITPIRSVITETADETYESPPVTDTLVKYASNSNIVFKYSQNSTVTTSTPTQDEINTFIESTPFVSPIDSTVRPTTEIKKITYDNQTKQESESSLAALPVKTSTTLENKSSNKTPINTVFKSQSMKRQVTFSIESLPANSTRQNTDTKSFSNEVELYNKQENSNMLETLSDEPESPNSEPENIHNTTVVASVEINKTFWTTATEFNSLLEIKEKCEVTSATAISEKYERKEMKVNKSTGIWSSMTSLMKSFMQSLSASTSSSTTECKPEEVVNWQRSLKRMRTYSDDAHDDLRIYKKIKLTDIKSRKPIHTLKTPYKVLKKKARMCDKSTQTD